MQYITKKHLSRRTFLRAGGATIGLPLLGAMIPAATALSQTAAAAKPRMGFFYLPHGAIMANTRYGAEMNRWTPDTEGRDFDLKPILEPFAQQKKYMTVVSGLGNRAAESPAVHAIHPGTWLTAVQPPRSQTPNSAVSVDQVAARHIGQDTRLPSLELTTSQVGARLAWRTPTQPLPQEGNPRAVFQKLFGQGDTDKERAAILHETDSILDRVQSQAKRLQSSLGVHDRVVVGDYLDSVREIERRVQMAEKADMTSLDIPDAPVGTPTDITEHFKLMFDLMALAFQADITRVITFSMDHEASMRTYTNLGIAEGFHPLSHHGNNPQKMDKLVQIQTYHTLVFAKFVDRLLKAKEADGTVLDHATILFGSNMSNSDKHNNDPLPSAIFGHANGRIKGGQHVKYPQDSRFADLLVTLFDRNNIPVEKLGDSGGPFSEI